MNIPFATSDPVDWPRQFASMRAPWASSLGQGMAEVETRIRSIADALPRGLAEPVQRLVSSGGKRIRPLVCLASHLAIRRGDPMRLPIPLAATVELIHTASLLHDDVVDEGTMRRGLPAPRMVWGNAASVLAGDHLLAKALQLVAAWGDGAILASLLDVLEAMTEAEAIQLSLRGSLRASVEEYRRILRGKTAGLFAWSAEAGARTAGAPPSQIAALREYGEAAGECFQLIDDVLDLESDPAVLGKDILADIREGKFTLPFILALEDDPSLAAELSRVLADTTRLQGGIPTEILERIRASRGIEVARREAAGAAERAKRCLGAIESSPARTAMQELVDLLLNRMS